MSSRREFIRSGALAMSAIAGAGASIAKAGAGAATAANPRATTLAALPIYAVIFDDRFEESRSFAAVTARAGLRTQSLDRGDVTRLWYDDLYHRWKEGPAAIAGLTTPNALFVLETFGNDAGLRLQFKAEHRPLKNQVEHRLYGPQAMLRSAVPLEGGESDWGARMGRIVSSGAGRFGRSEARLVTNLSAADVQTQGSMLVSWVLAPRAPRDASILTV